MKRKRISQFLLNSSNSATPDLGSRLDILEKSNVTILTKMEEIMKGVNCVNLMSERPCSKNKPNDGATENVTKSHLDLLDRLAKAHQESNMLLEKAARSTEDLKSTLRNTASLKRELEEWHNSVFKGQDSENLDEILTIVKSKLSQSFSAVTAASDPAGPDSIQRAPSPTTAKSPEETRTNHDVPGLGSTDPRVSYRRPGFGNTSTKTKTKRKKNARQHKIVLLTDSTMQGFKQEEFPKSYQVDVINKRSVEALTRSINKTVEDISSRNPDAVYIHLGTQDILKELDPKTIADDLINSVEKILRETSQNCKVFISHTPSCGKFQSKGIELKDCLSERIRSLSSDPGKSVFWVRVGENMNRNFLANGNDAPYKYLFVNDMVHLNHRGIRVIMGNFRTKLNLSFISRP